MQAKWLPSTGPFGVFLAAPDFTPTTSLGPPSVKYGSGIKGSTQPPQVIDDRISVDHRIGNGGNVVDSGVSGFDTDSPVSFRDSLLLAQDAEVEPFEIGTIGVSWVDRMIDRGIFSCQDAELVLGSKNFVPASFVTPYLLRQYRDNFTNPWEGDADYSFSIVEADLAHCTITDDIIGSYLAYNESDERLYLHLGPNSVLRWGLPEI
jgi:hypothetical protein